MISADRRPIIISGPSGVGKGTLISKLLERHPHTFTKTVSHTTRKARPGEKDGSDYYFITTAEFLSLIDQQAFVEYTTFNENYYGTSKTTIKSQAEQGKLVLLDIDMEGVKRMKHSGIAARYIFIKPPSWDALEARLKGRDTENKEEVQRRLARAKIELDYADTPGVHDKIIINDEIERACVELEGFIFQPGAATIETTTISEEEK